LALAALKKSARRNITPIDEELIGTVLSVIAAE